MSEPVDPAVESVTFLLAGLVITISARPVGSPTSAPPRVTATFEPPRRGPLLTAEVQDRLLLAESPRQLAAFVFPELEALSAQLRGGDTLWTPKARIHRAYRAGVAASLRLSGEFCDAASLAVPYQNAVYICLRCARHPSGFWATTYRIYLLEIGGQEGLEARESVSHAFASQAEGEAYLVGAHRPWPQQL